MKKQNIIGVLRVKNETRWLMRAIASIQPVCTVGVSVFDDHSDDDTARIAEAAGAILQPSPFNGTDEARDKQHIVQRIKAAAVKTGGECVYPSWVLMIDGDEELPASDREKILALVNQPDPAPAYYFRIAYLWDRPDQERVDGVYANLTRPSLFRLDATNGIFRATGSGGNFHCGSVPTDLRGKSQDSGATLLHYGYLHSADRVRKFEWYNKMDPGNETEDFYRHMVIGDLMAPAEVTKHAGPLRVRPLAMHPVIP